MNSLLQPSKNTEIKTASELSFKVMIVAGEASGDVHGASVVKSLLRASPQAEIFGMGGSAMRKAGAETVLDSETTASVMGFSEVALKFFELRRAVLTLQELAAERKPDVVLLVDFPDFNYFLAKAIKNDKRDYLKPQIIHFITPTVWAWRKGRLKTIKKYIDLAIPLYPFEEKFFKDNDVPAKYLGHPFLDEEIENLKIESLGLDSSKQLVSLLPGSRKAEIKSLLPDMLAATEILSKENPSLQFVLLVADSLELSFIEEFKSYAGDAWSKIKLIKNNEIKGGAASLMKASTLAVTASGTVTVEGMLAACPMLVIYRLSGVSFLIAKAVVKGVQNFAMPNILAGKQVVPELLQGEVSALSIANEVRKLLEEETLLTEMRKELADLKSSLSIVSSNVSPKVGTVTATERVAELVKKRALRMG